MRWIDRLKTCIWRWRLRNEQVPEGFDGEWYCQRYPDVAASGMAPELHYLRFGRYELRDPSPDFSASGYRYVVARNGRHRMSALRPNYAAPVGHPCGAADLDGSSDGSEFPSGLPLLDGGQPYDPTSPTLMVCAHQVGPELFGAERSLLDVLAAFRAQGVNLVITVPGAFNDDYLKTLRSLAWRLAILPYGWWNGSSSPVERTIGHFERLIKTCTVDAVYANTLVLREPILAAQRAGTPSVVHVRELLAHDKALCRILGASSSEMSAWLDDNVDLLVANSEYTAECLGLGGVQVVPNGMDVHQFLPGLRGERSSQGLVVGMVSSNLPKKGLSDFVALAGVLKSAAPQIRCRLIGPSNSHVDQLLKDQAKGLVPDNLEFAGYARSPQEALASLDVVVNLSHFQESFGRTVLEAMAAGLPVVAYRWGALPELVVHGETGFLVSLGDVESVAHHINLLAEDNALLSQMQEAGRHRAAVCFGKDAMEQALMVVMNRITGMADKPDSLKPSKDEPEP